MKSYTKLKVAYISDQQFPIHKADSEQVMNTVSALAGAGLDIELIVPRKWRDLFRSNATLKKRLMEFYGISGGFDLAMLAHLPLTRLRLEKYSHGLVAPIYSAVRGHDVIFTRNLLTARVSLLLQKKVIFETYRLYSHFKMAGSLARMLRSPNLIGVITHSGPSRESFLQTGVAPEKIAVIHNGFNPVHLRPRLSKSQARKKIGWARDEKIVSYTGRLDRDKGLDQVLQLAEQFQQAQFLFIGKSDKDAEDWLNKYAAHRGLTNVRTIPWMPTGKLSVYLYASDVLLIPPTAAPMKRSGKTVLPLKLFIYLAAGRPVLAPRLPDTLDLLNDQNAALVEPDHLPAARQMLVRIFADETWAEALANQALLDSSQLTWEKRAGRIIDFLKKRLEADGYSHEDKSKSRHFAESSL